VLHSKVNSQKNGQSRVKVPAAVQLLIKAFYKVMLLCSSYFEKSQHLYLRGQAVKVFHNRLRWPKGFQVGPQIFLTFGTMRVVGHQPYALAAFIPGEIPGTHF
jgi:hypothetical protein